MQLRAVISFTLATLLSVPFASFSATPQSSGTLSNKRKAKRTKFAPDLETLFQQDDQDTTSTLNGRSLNEVRQARLAKLAEKISKSGRAITANISLQKLQINGLTLPNEVALPEEPQSFIFNLKEDLPDVALQNQVALVGGKIRQVHENLRLAVIEAPRAAIRELATNETVEYISPDRPMMATGHLTSTTGAAQVRSLLGSTTTVDGRGVGIAIIDSGTVDNHYSLYTGRTSVRYDFVNNDARPMDEFGHGTHVASMALGAASWANGAYTGVAYKANLISIQVLDDYGQGASSTVIKAIDWCITNKAANNIRVINLSLGTTAQDSYLTDPLCLAARRAFNAGIVVVASAGNNGKAPDGTKIYGAINSPANDPTVITVGAANTFGTDARSDDAVATYSSRGPTRSYQIVNGEKKYDNLIKPDLVAPGNKIIGAKSASKVFTSTENVNTWWRNYLLNENLNLEASSDTTKGDYTKGAMYLSGTSMAAPVVSGAVALMVQVNPNLTPSLIKAILMYSAQPLKGFNMFEQGAGLINIDGAVRIAKLVKSTLPTTSGAALLTTALPQPNSTIAGENCKWSQGVVTNWGFLYGSNLMTQWQPVYGNGLALADATGVSNKAFSMLPGKVSGGISLYSGAVSITGSGLALADGIALADGLALADGIILSDGLALADGIILSDGIALADGLALADANVTSNIAFVGDNTACMLPAP